MHEACTHSSRTAAAAAAAESAFIGWSRSAASRRARTTSAPSSEGRAAPSAAPCAVHCALVVGVQSECHVLLKVFHVLHEVEVPSLFGGPSAFALSGSSSTSAVATADAAVTGATGGTGAVATGAAGAGAM